MPLAVFHIDLDGFESINERFGHPVGDNVLRIVAQRLRGCIRQSDTLCRYGGDEFAILMPHAENPRMSLSIAEKVLDALCQPYRLEQGMIDCLGASIGIAEWHPGLPLSQSVLLARANQAMYEAKKRGKKQYFLAAA